MTKDLLSGGTPDITSEACAWIAQLETGELTAADRDAFREWVRRSPRHAAEVKRLAKLSMDLNVLTDMAGPLQEVSAKYQPIIMRRGAGTKTLRFLAAAAVLAVTVTATYFLMPGEVISEPPRQIATAIGDYREFTLSDGTLVKLNTDSRIGVEYDRHERRVSLLKGEAFFDVTPNPERPFLVYAGGKSVRAVGTAFVVRLLEDDFGVTVVEGKVELTARTTVAGTSESSGAGGNQAGRGEPHAHPTGITPPIILKAGQSISIPATKKESPVVALTARELQRELSWQEGLHDFSDTPLEEVIREISRYSPLEIEITDPALRNIKFGGIFRTGETQRVFDALQESFGIEVERVDEHNVRLTLATQK